MSSSPKLMVASDVGAGDGCLGDDTARNILACVYTSHCIGASG